MNPVGLRPGHSSGCGCSPPRGRPGRLQRVSASGPRHGTPAPPSTLTAGGQPWRSGPLGQGRASVFGARALSGPPPHADGGPPALEIGRASCRERV